MNAFVTSPRLAFYTLTEHDAPLLLALLNEPSFIQYIGDRGVRNVDEALKYLRDGSLASYRLHGFGMYRVARQSDGKSIGLCGLVRRDYLSSPDLGYALFPEFAGQGFATEAAAAIFHYGKTVLNLPAIVGIVQASNVASKRVLEKVGLRPQGTVIVPDTGEELAFYVENLQHC